MVSVGFINSDHIEENSKQNVKKALPNKRKKIAGTGGGTGQAQGRQRTTNLTAMNLKEFNQAHTADYLSDDGEEAVACLLNIVYRAKQESTWPAKKQPANSKKGGQKTLSNKQGLMNFQK